MTVRWTWTTKFKPSGNLPPLPRIGVVMRVAGEFENLCWYGRGPWENYPDRKRSADMGVWTGTVTGQYVPYVKPQETGNKEDVRWLTLTDTNGTGLLVTAEGKPMAMSAIHFTAADLAAVRHNYELKPRPEVVLSLDAKQSGLGNSSCGPGVLERYAVLPAGTYPCTCFSAQRPPQTFSGSAPISIANSSNSPNYHD